MFRKSILIGILLPIHTLGMEIALCAAQGAHAGYLMASNKPYTSMNSFIAEAEYCLVASYIFNAYTKNEFPPYKAIGWVAGFTMGSLFQPYAIGRNNQPPQL